MMPSSQRPRRQKPSSGAALTGLTPYLGLAALLSTLGLFTASAQQPPAQPPAQGQTGETQTIVLDRPGRAQVRLAFPTVELDRSLSGAALAAAKEIEQTLRDDLEQDFLFNVQGPAELSVLALSGQREQDFEQYRSLGNEVVLLATVKPEDDKLALDGWVYDLPSQQSILGKRFRGTFQQARQVAHYMADALHYQFSGKPGIALTSIAFQSDRDGYKELYLMDYDGANQRRISAHKSTSGYPDWSPTGDAIAYMSYYSGNPGIYYVDLASNVKKPVYSGGSLSLSPSFSPDGRKIAFSHTNGSDIDIFVCNRQCSSPQQITASGGIDTNPAWSPDGSQIAFTSSRSGQPHIYLMSADGSNLRRITYDGQYSDGAAWRPDGTQIAYATRRGSFKFQIAVTNVVDLTTQVLTRGSDSYEEPTWSPDGQRLAFSVKRGGASQIYVMNADGSNWRQLTHEGNSSSPDWSSYPQQ